MKTADGTVSSPSGGSEWQTNGKQKESHVVAQP